MQEQIPEKQDRILAAALHVCAAFFFFTIMQAAAKHLAGRHTVVEIAFYRNALALMPFTLYILLRKRRDIVATRRPGAMLARVLVGTGSLLATFGAVQLLPLANATAIFFASTLLTPVFSYLFLRERVGPHRWAAVCIGMAGVLLVLQPGGAFHALGAGLALGAAFMHATVHVLLRHMREENPLTVTFYFMLGGAALTGLMMPWFASPLSRESLLPLAFIGVAGALGQYCLTHGMQRAPASLLAPLNYTGLIWATGLDMILWRTVPGWPVFAGAAIIIAANLYILRRERMRGIKARTAETELLDH